MILHGQSILNTAEPIDPHRLDSDYECMENIIITCCAIEIMFFILRNYHRGNDGIGFKSGNKETYDFVNGEANRLCRVTRKRK